MWWLTEPFDPRSHAKGREERQRGFGCSLRRCGGPARMSSLLSRLTFRTEVNAQGSRRPKSTLRTAPVRSSFGGTAGGGSIPACAGEPITRATSVTTTGVYPCVCGGTWVLTYRITYAIGLSPRVRGNPITARNSRDFFRSIPACAGEPVAGLVFVVYAGVYPRVCGGTIHARSRASYHSGLSPRVRGNHYRASQSFLINRSIPACAGEPGFHCSILSFLPVYPRVCGGTDSEPKEISWEEGLSPHVRGNLRRGEGWSGGERSIPACAGEPGGADYVDGQYPVYPRVCGGTTFASMVLPNPPGLSPRVRGNLLRAMRISTMRRSIPACAGEPHRRSTCWC